jgi:hypothetical protein
MNPYTFFSRTTICFENWPTKYCKMISIGEKKLYVICNEKPGYVVSAREPQNTPESSVQIREMSSARKTWQLIS